MVSAVAGAADAEDTYKTGALLAHLDKVWKALGVNQYHAQAYHRLDYYV